MRRKAIRCAGVKDGHPCGNILCYITEGKLICLRHGRAIEVSSESLGRGSIVITCERCGKKTLIETSSGWRIKL